MASAKCYPEKAPQVNQLLDTLSHPIRREVIYYFESHAQEDEESLATLVSHIDGRIPSTNPAEVEVALHHRHLPKLDERAWIAYGAEENLVRYHGKEDAQSRLSELAAIF
jgi:hypothetical protein